MTALLSDLTGYLTTLAGPNIAGAIGSRMNTGEQDLGTLTWTATVAPSGTITKKYICIQTDLGVRVVWMIKCQNVGTIVTGVSTPLPAVCPTPWNFSTQTVNAWAYYGVGGILPLITTLSSAGSAAGLYKESDGSYSLKVNSGTLNLGAGLVLASVDYLLA